MLRILLREPYPEAREVTERDCAALPSIRVACMSHAEFCALPVLDCVRVDRRGILEGFGRRVCVPYRTVVICSTEEPYNNARRFNGIPERLPPWVIGTSHHGPWHDQPAARESELEDFAYFNCASIFAAIAEHNRRGRQPAITTLGMVRRRPRPTTDETGWMRGFLRAYRESLGAIFAADSPTQ